MAQYFEAKEFLCPCGHCNGGTINPRLLELLDRIRDWVKFPMKVTSGFRCPEHNKAVGGVANSYHLSGEAADISAPTGSDKFALINAALGVGITGIGIKSDMLHFDIRPIPAIWTY